METCAGLSRVINSGARERVDTDIGVTLMTVSATERPIHAIRIRFNDAAPFPDS
jgi:hypothetical protein